MARLPRWTTLSLLCCAVAAGGCGQMRFAQMPLPTVKPEVVGGGDSRLEMARMSERLGRTDLAKQFYRDALLKNPGSQVAHHRLAVLAVQEQRWREAAAHFDRAHELGPPNAELLNDLAYAFYQRGKMAHAEKTLRRALDLEPENPKARSLLALTLGEQGRHQESLAAFRQVVQSAESDANPEAGYQQFSIAAKPQRRGHSMERTRTQLAAAGVRPPSRRPPAVEPDIDRRGIETPEPPEMVVSQEPVEHVELNQLPPEEAAAERVAAERVAAERVAVVQPKAPADPPVDQTPSPPRIDEKAADAAKVRPSLSLTPQSPQTAEETETPALRLLSRAAVSRPVEPAVALPQPAPAAAEEKVVVELDDSEATEDRPETPQAEAVAEQNPPKPSPLAPTASPAENSATTKAGRGVLSLTRRSRPRRTNPPQGASDPTATAEPPTAGKQPFAARMATFVGPASDAATRVRRLPPPPAETVVPSISSPVPAKEPANFDADLDAPLFGKLRNPAHAWPLREGPK